MAQQKVRSPGSQWIDDHWAELERDYPNEYVAADGNGLIAHDADYTRVVDAVVEKGKTMSDVTYAFIPAGISQ